MILTINKSAYENTFVPVKTIQFSLLLTGIVLAQLSADQDTIIIPGGIENAGLLEATINGDTVINDERIHPYWIYWLQKNEIYFQRSAIVVFESTNVRINISLKYI